MLYIHYKVTVCSYIFKPVPDDGFQKSLKCSTFWTIKVLSEYVVVICSLSVYLFIHMSQWDA